MSLLTICQNVCAVVGWPRPNAIAANTDATAQQIFALANLELQRLSERFCWPHLEVEYPFATAAGQSTYYFPADFRVLAENAIFDASEYYAVKGSQGLPYWQLLKYGKLGSLARTRFRVVYPDGVEITPAPVNVRNFIAVYYSKNYAANSAGGATPRYVADSDVSRIPEQYIELGLMWRFRRAKGLDFSAELAEYNETIPAQYASIISLGEIPVGGRRELSGLTDGYVRENGFGA